MQICLTVKEILEMARSCLQGGCSECALNDACKGYDDLANLCQIMPEQKECVQSFVPTGKQNREEAHSTQENGGVMRSTDELADEILAAGSRQKTENKAKIAAEDKRRIRKLLSAAAAENGDEVVEAMLQAANGALMKEEIHGMLSGMKLPIDLWRIAEQALYDAGYVGY